MVRYTGHFIEFSEFSRWNLNRNEICINLYYIVIWFRYLCLLVSTKKRKKNLCIFNFKPFSFLILDSEWSEECVKVFVFDTTCVCVCVLSVFGPCLNCQMWHIHKKSLHWQCTYVSHPNSEIAFFYELDIQLMNYDHIVEWLKNFIRWILFLSSSLSR